MSNLQNLFGANGFDSSSYDKTQTFEPLPAGYYVLHLVDSELKPTKSGHMISAKFEVLEGAFKGRKFRTKKYDAYIATLMLILPKLSLPKPPYSINLVVGYSNVLSDIDNCLKPFIDCLQKKYLFNDRDIYKLSIEKKIIKKGKEFINFEIKSLLFEQTEQDKISNQF